MFERWEIIKDEFFTKKMRVPGGWIYMYEVWSTEQNAVISATTCFVPEPPTPSHRRQIPPAD